MILLERILGFGSPGEDSWFWFSWRGLLVLVLLERILSSGSPGEDS